MNAQVSTTREVPRNGLLAFVPAHSNSNSDFDFVFLLLRIPGRKYCCVCKAMLKSMAYELFGRSFKKNYN
jgi:hypothetical protein